MKLRLDRFNESEREQRLIDMAKFKLDTVEPIIMWGNLLGAVREKGFIAHDDDIDLAYISNYHTLLEVRDELYEIYSEINAKGWLKKIFMRNGAVYELPPKNEFKGVGQCHWQVGVVYCDLWTMWFDENEILHSCPYLNLGKKEDYLPLKEYELHGHKFLSINNAEKLLKRIYGNWQVPSENKSPEKISLLL